MIRVHPALAVEMSDRNLTKPDKPVNADRLLSINDSFG